MNLAPQELSLPGLFLIKPTIHRDARGFFFESYQQERYSAFLPSSRPFCQDNHSLSQQGTLRGLHLQTSPWQAKLIRVLEGEIFDVALDLRLDSPTFGQWEGLMLDANEHHQLYIPAGFAHGFCVTSPQAQVHYKVDVPYNPSEEMTLCWDDPDLKIAWPKLSQFLLSPRDQAGISFKELTTKLKQHYRSWIG